MWLLLVLLGVVRVSGYECTDGCTIDDGFYDDGFCDCLDCGDELSWDCSTCACPTVCGAYTWCQGMPVNNNTGTFECDDGCSISEAYHEDDWCDCTQCEDETDWTCETCPGGCPEICGGYVMCASGGNYTNMNDSFTCDDGCKIFGSYVADDWCDCAQCEDETDWSCDSCPGGCPTICGGFVDCTGSGGNNYTNGFTCDDGCEIPPIYQNDNWCDCTQCEDEVDWSCETCPGGCPTVCGAYVMCQGGNNTSPGFTCDDGCGIFGEYQNDDFCDCSQCEDETNWNCETCGGCPDSCGGYVECEGGGGDGFICDDGCEISNAYVGDGWCDCGQCEEEENWTCDTCGDCPLICGDYVKCGYNPTQGPITSMSGMYTCDDGCIIPGMYVNDDWCDCSNCEEEAEWTCELCGACPWTCGAYVPCEGGNYTGSFTCDDGCEIPEFYHEDDWCDCINCEDESDWTCETCGGCPQVCGGYMMCGGGNMNNTGSFTCDDGCDIFGSYHEDDWCDCSNCEDESDWTCETCGGCPDFCGGYMMCGDFPNFNSTFTCDDGCEITGFYQSDDFCDCTECEDELAWTCDSCPGGCPATCGAYVDCGMSLNDSFTCDDGCKIPMFYHDDDWCDCVECEDESQWTCDTCGGCPTLCGAFKHCMSGNNYTDVNDTAFMCDNGCYINAFYFNDNWCDCTECEDELFWDCDTCGGCPEYCGGYVPCEGIPQTTADVRTTRPTQYKCNDGCVLPLTYHNDDFCDCTECEDEPNWECGSCSGGCPLDCGSYGKCDGEPPMTECPDNCAIAEARVNDGHCDCSDCADEFTFTCDTCDGGCPNECGERKNCVARVVNTEAETTDVDERAGVVPVSMLLSTALAMFSALLLTI